MIYQRYSRRLSDKLSHLNNIYGNLIFQKIGEVENPFFIETKDHLRSVPTEGWEPLAKGKRWGGEWNNMWIKTTITVPEAAAGRKLYVVSKANAVEILYFINSVPKGIFNSKHDFIGGMHAAQLITADAVPGNTFDLAFECYAGHFCVGCHPYDNYGVTEGNPDSFYHTYDGMDLCVMNEDVKDFVYDLKAVIQMANDLPDNNFLKGQAQDVLEQVVQVVVEYPIDYPQEIWQASVVKARELMKNILADQYAETTRGKVGIVGHSHMDTAWLWPVSETVRKCARTYANALHLMEQYPEYKFIQSSVLHLDWMRRYYPDIFEGIKKMTAEGRYEPNGGVWVECDCNITSGESMVRQFLKGQLYTRKHLNYTADSFWLPDTFGYNAAIPQIMQESEVKYFYTTKISWNDLNRFPLDTFRWKGIDGSSVLTHFNLTHTFPDVHNVVRAVEEIPQKQVSDSRLLAFGFGDGGGGPTYGMIEDARRAKDIPGLPNSHYTTISDFMQEIEKTADKLPVYSGELYLELHRGTLTQMHDIKRNNRKAEFALHNMEYMNVLSGSGKNACSDDLYECLLKNQFHDILPGTSLTCVNELARKEVTEVITKATDIALDYASAMTDGATDAVTLFNTLSFDRNNVVYLDAVPGKTIADHPTQSFTDVTGKEKLAVGGVSIPAYGAVTLAWADESITSATTVSPFLYDGIKLETPFAKVAFDENGYMASFVDKSSGRELRRAGGTPLNTFWLAEDVPLSWDDWDVDPDLESKMLPQTNLISREVVSNGTLEFRIRSVYQVGKRSIITQDMIFHADNPQVDFHTVIDWKDKHSFLKAGFDVDVMASVVNNEIQFGHIARPTTRNNALEASKFEVCNYKWSDLSESRFGVAILNDCKYGISVNGSDMRLSLHKGGCHPDVTGDAGVHEMTYSFLPHAGGLSVKNVIQPAYTLNVPSLAVKGALQADVTPLVQVDADNIICETVKPAELRENAFVLRLYECERNKTACTLTFGCDVKKVFLTNMLEDVKEELPVVDGKVSLQFRPFQIVTVLVER